MIDERNMAAEIHALRKAGDLRAAYELANEARSEHPDDLRVTQALGWVYYQMVKNARQRAKDGPKGDRERHKHQLANALREYYQLRLPTPDMLHSFIISQVLSFEGAEELLFELVAYGGVEGFRREDYRTERSQDGQMTFKSLVERVASVLAKVAVDGDNKGHKLTALSVIDAALDGVELENPENFRYRKGQLLADLGRLDEAQELLVPFVRQRHQEYWAWDALGRAYESTEPELALALYAKSWLMCPEPDFRVRVDESVARLAAQLGYYGLARWAVELTAAHRRSRSWRLTGGLQAMLSAPWFDQSEPDAEPVKMLEQLAEEAMDLLYSDAKWVEATFLETYKSKRGKLYLALAVQNGDRIMRVSAPARLLKSIELLGPGDPLAAQVVEDEGLHVRSIKPRPGGGAFDILDTLKGVIDHHNETKGLTSVYLPGDSYVLLHHNRFPEAIGLNPGSWVQVRVAEDARGFRAYGLERTEPEQSEWIQRFVGSLRVHDKGFGFLEGFLEEELGYQESVFVPPPLVRELEGSHKGNLAVGVQNIDNQFAVLAVRKRSKKRATLGWTAVSISKEEDQA